MSPHSPVHPACAGRSGAHRRADAPSPAADLIAELGGACCPSFAALLERLIDRQGAQPADPRGMRA